MSSVRTQRFACRQLRRFAKVIAAAFKNTSTALLSGDKGAAETTIVQDEAVDALERQIEEEAIAMIVRRQPVALDLRDIMAATRIASELEKIRDLAKNLAKRSLTLGDDRPPQDLLTQLDRMSILAENQLRQVLDAYVQREDKAIAIREGDSEVDLLNTSVFKGVGRSYSQHLQRCCRRHTFALLRQKYRTHRRPHH